MVGFTVVSAVWVENQFAIPGMGTLTAIGVGNSDGPLLMTMFFTLMLFILLTRLGLDMLRRWWDPRSRLDAARCLSTGAFTHRYPR